MVRLNLLSDHLKAQRARKEAQFEKVKSLSKLIEASKDFGKSRRITLQALWRST